MLTTLELPTDLLERARRAAQAVGVSLEEWIRAALDRELPAQAQPATAARHLEFPVFSSAKPGSLSLTGVDIAQAEAEEDRRRHGLPG